MPRHNWRPSKTATTGHSSNSVSQYQAARTEQPTGNAFETVDHARQRVLRGVVDEQVYVFGLTVHLDELRLEVSANFLEHDFEPLESASVKYLSSIFGDEDQVDLQCENAMPAVTNIASQ